MIQRECVSREQLEKYVLGNLAEADWQTIAEHLESCERCEETVSQLDSADDTFIRALREPSQADPDSTAYRLAARRAKSQNSQKFLISSPSAEDADPPGQFVRDYELLAPIARGGMGTVYQAVHRRLGRQVALKVLPARRLASAHDVARFQREMQAVGQLQHPAIVQATDGGEVDGIHYLVMEFVDGIDLNTLVKCIGKLSQADACELARRTAIGLTHAHERGVIHRDVKPSNVMLNVAGDIKILDLGLARIVGEQMVADELTTVGQLMGTLDYMAPEQFENSHQADERGDVYGLGATLFKLLTGSAPYSGQRPDSHLAKLRRIAAEAPPSLLTKRSDLPKELADYVDRMLSRRPEDRPATMQEVAADLERWSVGHGLRDLARNGLARRAAIAKDLNVACDLATGHVSKPQQNSSEIAKPNMSQAASGNSLRWIAALLMLGILAVLAAVIIVQTTSGQLVIETTVPDIEVKVLKAGEPFKTLTLTQTPNTLRLGSGDFEIQLVGQADGLEVQNNKFTLKRGQTVVARVTHTPEAGQASNEVSAVRSGDRPHRGPSDPVAIQMPPRSSEPLYDGKTTSEWIADLQQDRSPSRVIAAFTALQKLGLDRNRQGEAIAAVFNATQYHDEKSGIKPSEANAWVTVWATAALTLSRFDSPSVVAHASQLLEKPMYPTGFILHLLANEAETYRPHFSERLEMQLVHCIESSKEPKRYFAIAALSNLQGASDPQFLAKCRTWLSAPDEGLRLHAASNLAAGGQVTAEVLTVLRELLKSQDTDVVIEAIAILRDIGPGAKPAVPDLISIVESKKEPNSNEWRTKRGITLRQMVTNKRTQAFEALGNIGDSSVAPVLIRQWRQMFVLQGLELPEASKLQAFANTEHTNRHLLLSIKSLTGLQFHSSRAGAYWTVEGRELSSVCLDFLNSPVSSKERNTAREDIEKLLLVVSQSDVEQAIPSAVANMSADRGTASAVDLCNLLRPALSPKSEYRSLVEALTIRTRNQRTEGRLAQVRLIQKLLGQRAAESPEARSQVLDALAAAIENQPASELIDYVDTLVALGAPDDEHSKRIAAALEKHRDSEIEWKVKAADRGLEFLRGESKPSEPLQKN